MNKQELITLINSKMPLNMVEFDKEWQEVEQNLKAKGITDRLEEKTAGRLYRTYTNLINDKSEAFEGVILADSGIKDFGASKLFETMKKSWDTSSDEVKKIFVNSKQFDNNGNPLWNDISSPKRVTKWQNKEDGTWKTTEERLINPEKDKQRSLVMLVRKTSEQEFKVGNMLLWSDKVDLPVPLGYKVQFRAKGDITDNKYRVSSTKTTSFTAISTEVIPFDELLQVVDKYFAECKVDLSVVKPSQALADFSGKPLMIAVNSIVTRVTLTGANVKNNVLNVTGISGKMDAKEEVTCWANKNLPLNVGDDDSEVVLFLQPMNNPEKLTANVLGVFTPVNPVVVQPIKEEEEVSNEGW